MAAALLTQLEYAGAPKIVAQPCRSNNMQYTVNIAMARRISKYEKTRCIRFDNIGGLS